MKPTLKLLSLAAAVALVAPSASFAASDTMQGMIISREGHKLVVRIGDADTDITLTDTTKIQAITGPLGGSRENRPVSDLINGLAVNIDTVQNGSEIDASKITFKPKDLKTAMTVQAGTAQARQRARNAQAQNERRLSEVGQFTEKGRLRIFFDTGSAAISAKSESDLEAFAQKAMAIPGSLLRVVGHADATGNAAANQRLSTQRASAVTAFLVRRCKVPGERFAGSGGLGSTQLTDDTPAANAAEDRRVTVFILTSKAAEK